MFFQEEKALFVCYEFFCVLCSIRRQADCREETTHEDLRWQTILLGNIAFQKTVERHNYDTQKHQKCPGTSESVTSSEHVKVKSLILTFLFLARGAFASPEEVLPGEKMSIVFNEMAGIWLCICLFVIIPVGLWNLAIVAKLRKLAKEKGKEKAFNEWILDPWKFNRSMTLKEECLFRDLDLALCIKYLRNGRICYFCLLCVVICFSVYYYARMI